MGRVRVTAAVILLVLVMLLAVNAASVWAVSVTPSSPTAGQSFTVTNNDPSNPDNIQLFFGSGCGSGGSADGSPIPVAAGGSASAPAQHAGSYSAGAGEEDMPLCVDFTVNPATPTTSVSCLVSTLDVGSMTTCTATVSGAAFGASTVDGDTISWSDAGSVSFSSASCTLSGSSCSVTVTGTAAGSATVTWSFSGDGDNAPSSGTFPLTINSTTPIPEYPLGLPLLAILTVIAYGVIRRKTATKQT
ncbi:MAG: hypothetical protein ABSF63_15120 [Candidatus Bathyarchaeia archaeon]